VLLLPRRELHLGPGQRDLLLDVLDLDAVDARAAALDEPPRLALGLADAGVGEQVQQRDARFQASLCHRRRRDVREDVDELSIAETVQVATKEDLRSLLGSCQTGFAVDQFRHLSSQTFLAQPTVRLCFMFGHNRVDFVEREEREVLEERADILVAAIGRAHFVTADMVNDGAVVIDVGINRIPDATKKSGSRLTGDVDFDQVAPKCSWITPVPGGVGPMTIASLMQNTLQACANTDS